MNIDELVAIDIRAVRLLLLAPQAA